MKTNLSILVSIYMVFAVSCSKKTSAVSTADYRGVIVTNTCCQIVVQSIGSNAIGQASWTDSSDAIKKVYQNVFRVSNPCDFGGHKVGDTISFRIVPQKAQTCACCMLFVYTPQSSYPIEVK